MEYAQEYKDNNPDLDPEDLEWDGSWDAEFEYCRSISGPGYRPQRVKPMEVDIEDPIPSKADRRQYNKMSKLGKQYGEKMDWDSEFYNDKFADKRNPANWPNRH